MGVSRVYIFEDDFIAQKTSNTFEWCAQGSMSEIANLQAFPIELAYDWYEIIGSNRSS